ncbi:MAG: DUF3570 domain-containing protein [Sulfuricellaceae bacterium]
MDAISNAKLAVQALAGAALALPVLMLPVQAGQLETARGGIKFLSYSEKDRMEANSPLLWAEAPLGENFDVAATVTLDSVSGASPQYVSNRSGSPVHTLTSASIIEERREAGVKVTRHFDEGSLGLGASASSEHDYLSQSVNADMRFDFNEKNTTLAFGVGETNDRIGSSTQPTLDEPRTTRDYLVGVTQLLTPVSLVQSNLTYADGNGYFNDPYKYTLSYFLNSRIPVMQRDTRPDGRSSAAWLTRYRHYVPAWNTALLADYRYYRDNWDIRAHTFDLGLTKELARGLKIAPSLRYYTQSPARFYASSFTNAGDLGSSDARLSGFGAITASFKLIYAMDERTSLDASFARYRQEAAYRLGGNGSEGFPTLNANFLMVGMSRIF